VYANVICGFIMFVVFLDREELFDNFKTPEYFPLEKLKVSICCCVCNMWIMLSINCTHRITYKLCLIMHLVHSNPMPHYLSDSFQTVARSSSRPGLRSSNTAVYVKPRYRRCRTKFGECGFSHAGPTAWNSLPHHLHHISDTGLFKCCLKTELICRAYIVISC